MWIQRLFWAIFWQFREFGSPMECSFQLSPWHLTWIVCYPSHLQSLTHWCRVWGMLSAETLEACWSNCVLLCYPRHYFTVHGMPNDALKKLFLLQYLAFAPRNSPLNGSLEIATSHHHLPEEELGTRKGAKVGWEGLGRVGDSSIWSSIVQCRVHSSNLQVTARLQHHWSQGGSANHHARNCWARQVKRACHLNMMKLDQTIVKIHVCQLIGHQTRFPSWARKEEIGSVEMSMPWSRQILTGLQVILIGISVCLGLLKDTSKRADWLQTHLQSIS